MHKPGASPTQQANPVCSGIAREVGEFFLNRMRRLNDCGVELDQIILDVGIGFGKSPGQNLQLLGALRGLTEMERPLLLGASRKSFIGKLLGAEPGARLAASLACACLAVEAGVQIIRAHDVAETVQAIRMTEAILASIT
jgi:dihydropteroate synthase